MRIYAVADIHADPERIDKIRSVTASCQPDVLVAAGDIINYIFPSKTLRQLNDLPVPVLMVRGNSDPGYVDKYVKQYANLNSLNLKQVIINSVPFSGLSGTIPLPFRNRVGFSEKRLMDQIASMIHPQTVLVAHTPPYGCLDQVAGRFHSGSKMIRRLVKEKQPRMMICGHIHEAAGIEAVGRTIVVNCSLPKNGQGMMIELEADRRPVIENI